MKFKISTLFSKLFYEKKDTYQPKAPTESPESTWGRGGTNLRNNKEDHIRRKEDFLRRRTP